jgi:hypothetical protein
VFEDAWRPREVRREGVTGADGLPGAGAASSHLADAVLNLSAGKHSDGLSRLAGIESARGSFGQAGEAIGRVTGTRLGKRQNWQKAPLPACAVTSLCAAARGQARCLGRRNPDTAVDDSDTSAS